MKKKPIGIFDSGIGGLTVVKEVINILPNENLIYLGDTARVPYGTRGKEVIKKFSLELTDFLLKQNVKFLVIACNTISSTCLGDIQKISSVPVIGVIKPSASAIAKATKNKRVGIIGTKATIGNKAYEKEIKKIDSSIKIFSKEASLFVPLAEEGLGNSKIAKLTAEYYLSGFKNIDTLHLGCTHFPLLKEVIQEVVGKSVKLIDSAIPTVEELRNTLIKKDLLNDEKSPILKFFFTDITDNTPEISSKFLGKNIDNQIFKIKLS